MKKFLALLLTTVLCIGLVACGGSSTSSTPDKNDAAPVSNSTDSDKPADSGSKKKLLYFCAFIGDFGLGDMGYRAAQTAAEKYDLDLTLIEFGTDNSVAVNGFLDAIETSNYDYVLASSWYISDTVIENAPSYPDSTFILFDTSPQVDLSANDNVYGITFGQNEGGFLVGVYSALMSQSGTIGCTLRSDTPILNDFGTGWLAGYKYATKELGKDTKMMYTYIGEDSIQSSYESCKVMYDNGVDFLWSVAGTNVLGACQASDEKGGLEKGYAVIGVDYDQYEYFKQIDDATSARGYENLITSMLKNIEPCVALIFESVIDGKGDIKPGNTFYGVASGGTGLAENSNYIENTPEDIRAQIEEIAGKITAGEIVVPSYFDFNSYEAYATYRDNPEADFVA